MAEYSAQLLCTEAREHCTNMGLLPTVVLRPGSAKVCQSIEPDRKLNYLFEK